MNYKYEFDKEKCWYKDVCKEYNTEICNRSCVRYIEMFHLMNQSEIPKKKQVIHKLYPQSTDIPAFKQLKEIQNDIVNFVNNGESLYIYSSGFGNGKTTWGIKLLQQYFHNIWRGNGLKCRGVFIHVPNFITKIKENIYKKEEYFEKLKEKVEKTDLVVWDDIGANKLSEFDYTNLLTFIDQRKLHELSNIYTGNLSGDELKIALGGRLYSRVWNESSRVEIIGEDRRGRR